MIFDKDFRNKCYEAGLHLYNDDLVKLFDKQVARSISELIAKIKEIDNDEIKNQLLGMAELILADPRSRRWEDQIIYSGREGRLINYLTIHDDYTLKFSEYWNIFNKLMKIPDIRRIYEAGSFGNMSSEAWFADRVLGSFEETLHKEVENVEELKSDILELINDRTK